MTIGRSLESRHNLSVILAFGPDQNILIRKKDNREFEFLYISNFSTRALRAGQMIIFRLIKA